VHLPLDSAKASALRAEVKSLQDNEVIFHIDNPDPGFYSHIFVVPKKQKGSWRLIIDLSRLSRFLRVPQLKVETTRSEAASILPGDWAVSLDAYLHVPRTSRLSALSSILLRRSSISVQGFAFRTGLCSADISVNRKGVCSTTTHSRAKTSLLHRRFAPPQRLQRHSER
jgi:hypothetical protein